MGWEERIEKEGSGEIAVTEGTNQPAGGEEPLEGGGMVREQIEGEGSCSEGGSEADIGEGEGGGGPTRGVGTDVKTGEIGQRHGMSCQADTNTGSDGERMERARQEEHDNVDQYRNKGTQTWEGGIQAPNLVGHVEEQEGVQWWLDEEFLDWNVAGGEEEETLHEFGDRLGLWPEDWVPMEVECAREPPPNAEQADNQQPPQRMSEEEERQAWLDHAMEEMEKLRLHVPINMQKMLEEEEDSEGGRRVEGEQQGPGDIVGIRLRAGVKEMLGNKAKDIEEWKIPRWQAMEVMQAVEFCCTHMTLQDTLARAREKARIHEEHARVSRKSHEEQA